MHALHRNKDLVFTFLLNPCTLLPIFVSNSLPHETVYELYISRENLKDLLLQCSCI